MKVDKQLVESADFSFDYFLNGGLIICTCPNCSSKIELKIKIYESGTLIEKLEQELIDNLLSNRIINLKDENVQIDNHLRKYVLWRMDARYEKMKCKNCAEHLIAIFGMAEIQPGREYVQFKGIWNLKSY